MTSVNIAFTVYGLTYAEILESVQATLKNLGVSEDAAMSWDSELTILPDDQTTRVDGAATRWKAEFLSRFSTTTTAASVSE